MGKQHMSTILTTNLNNLIWCVVLLRSLSKSGYKITEYIFFIVTRKDPVCSLSKKLLKFATVSVAIKDFSQKSTSRFWMSETV